MLISEHRGGHQHSHLLRVGSCLEGRPYGHLGLAEAHIATHKPVHRPGTLHVMLHILRSLELIRRILIEERSLELMLHESVGAESEAFLTTPFSIELYQIARYVLDALLGAFLEPLPGSAAQNREFGFLAGPVAAILGYLIK